MIDQSACFEMLCGQSQEMALVAADSGLEWSQGWREKAVLPNRSFAVGKADVEGLGRAPNLPRPVLHWMVHGS